MKNQIATLENPVITYYPKLEQQTPEWFKARAGIPTVSLFKNLVTAKGKISNNQTVRDYAYELATQRETGIIEDGYSGYHTDRGNYEEPIARKIYNDNVAEVEECGFIVCDFGVFKVGGSPDGLVGEDGGIEIKSRISKYQTRTIITDEVEAQYLDQVKGSMFVSQRKWWEFVQYSNGMPLFRKKFTPDLEWQAVMMQALIQFESLIQSYQVAYRENCKGLIKTERIEYVTGSYDDDNGIVASEG